MTGLRIHICHWRIIGAGDRNGCRRFGGQSFSVRHHITHGNRRAFTLGQAVKITARHKLQLVVNDADRALTGYRVAVAINDLHAVQTEAGRIITHIGIVSQHVNHESFILMTGLCIHICHWRIISASNRYGCRGFGTRPLIIGHHITHGDCRTFTAGQAVKITARRKL